MKPLELTNIAGAIGADFAGAGTVAAVSTDTRTLPAGCLFVALEGERFDGHDYVRQALNQGAAWAVVSKPGDYPPDRTMTVPDTRQALLDIARLYRQILDVKVVGVTGSVGKTTTKDMTAGALSAAMPTLKTEANLNNEVGLPTTIFKLEEHHRAAVLEMGMDGPGQIAPLSWCAMPDVGIVTNVGVSHLEAMGSRESILREKLELGSGMADGTPLLVCGDNDLLAQVQSDRLRVVRYGVDNPDCDILAQNIRELEGKTRFDIIQRGEGSCPVELPCLGGHNVRNALAAFGAATLLGVSPRQAVEGLKNYRPSGMRQKVVVHNSVTVVEDCYNASPDSMRAALDTLSRMDCSGRRIAVLSDMLELGSIEKQAHVDVGALAAKSNLDWLVCCGPLSQGYVEGAKDTGMEQALHFPDQQGLFDWLRRNLRQGDTVWFKASRGMKLEQVIAKFYKEC